MKRGDGIRASGVKATVRFFPIFFFRVGTIDPNLKKVEGKHRSRIIIVVSCKCANLRLSNRNE